MCHYHYHQSEQSSKIAFASTLATDMAAIAANVELNFFIVSAYFN